MKWMRRAWVGCLLVFMAFTLARTPLAMADTMSSIISGDPVVVRPGDVIEDVVVVGNNAKIAGDVYEALVVFNGNVTLASTARVGVLIDFGGKVEKEPGAQVHAQYTVSSGTPFWNTVLLSSSLVFLAWFARLVVSLAIVVVPIVVAVIFRQRIDGSVHMVTQSIRRMGIAGLLGSLGTLAVAGTLAVTMVGIPLSALVLGVYILIGCYGWTAVSIWFGRIIVQSFDLGNPTGWAACAIGSSVLMAFSNVPVVGPLIFLMFWCVGVGAATTGVWRWFQGRRK